MRIQLDREDRADFAAHKPPGWLFAWSEFDDSSATIHVERGTETRKRIGHEIRHCRDRDLSHHPWWHFCIQVRHPWRTWRHGLPELQEQAADLLSVGVIDFA